MVRFGRWGLIVPALTLRFSANFALANFLASCSLRNVLVALACDRFPRGTSNETYHVPWDFLAMRPSRGLRRRLTAVLRTSNRRRTESFRLRPVGPRVTSGGRQAGKWDPRNVDARPFLSHSRAKDSGLTVWDGRGRCLNHAAATPNRAVRMAGRCGVGQTARLYGR